MNIKQLSQEVGIGEDTLRVWERRYDFPRPKRDRRGRRQYPHKQVEQLRVIRQLQLDGYRPGAIFKLEPKQRMELLHQAPNHQHMKQLSLEWILNAGPDEILLWLGQQLKTMGLEKFIRECSIPLIYFVDLSWKTGAIGVAREHLISDQLSVALHQYLDRCNRINREKPAKSHCLCLTLNHERHKLGLLMAACIIGDSGIHCTWLQEDLPLSEIEAALKVTSTNVVVLSFSIHYTTRAAMEQLATLRQMLPASIPIIAGGGALEGEKNIPGVHISTDLMQLAAMVKGL